MSGHGSDLEPSPASAVEDFADDLRRTRRTERRLLVKELAALFVVAAVITVRQLWLS